MNGDSSPQLPIAARVRAAEHPVEAAVEADARDAARRFDHRIVRGPVFGVAARMPADGDGWRVVSAVDEGTAQQARDWLQSHLWFRARDDTDDPAVRRELLAAVARLETERVDELEVCGTRFRVVRGEEYVHTDGNTLEPPRPTDPDPAEPDWDRRSSDPAPDLGFTIDPAVPVAIMAHAERMSLRDHAYTGPRFPADVLADSARAVHTHPEVVVLPVTFGAVERTPGGWTPRLGGFATPHDVRRSLHFGLTLAWPMLYDLDDDARAAYARVAEEFRAAGRPNELRVDGRHYLVVRIGRMVRVGTDGPEPPRPSDIDMHPPTRMHPSMDENGVITHEEDEQEE
ncbi:DUF5954 family protein [Embleya sp. AB8]|uniref:DUF5954 family protein n=1 Tax=Embleya sp. AB8 TaxID=3156304 RepID=UPI003C78FE92